MTHIQEGFAFWAVRRDRRSLGESVREVDSARPLANLFRYSPERLLIRGLAEHAHIIGRNLAMRRHEVSIVRRANTEGDDELRVEFLDLNRRFLDLNKYPNIEVD